MRCGRVVHLLQKGKSWVVDADIQRLFRQHPTGSTAGKLSEHISDGGVLELVRGFLKQGVMESGKDWQPTENGQLRKGL